MAGTGKGMAQPTAQNSTIRNVLVAGILLMLAGDFLFALNDAMGKWLVASFSVGQVVLIRSVGAFFVLSAYACSRCRELDCS